VDGIVYPTRGFSGCTVRTFDVAAQRWSIYWINSHTGTLSRRCTAASPTAVASSTAKTSTTADWCTAASSDRQVPDTPRWEQAFSLDSKTWETNWIMEFTAPRESRLGAHHDGGQSDRVAGRGAGGGGAAEAGPWE
jgi:hypothetical protein